MAEFNMHSPISSTRLTHTQHDDSHKKIVGLKAGLFQKAKNLFRSTFFYAIVVLPTHKGSFMSEINGRYMDAQERRRKARNIRALSRIDNSADRKTIDEIIVIHKISKTNAYRILAELEEWETNSTFAQEAADIALSYPKYSTKKWLLVSGKMLLAYIQGEISASVMGSSAPEQDDLLA
jgi:hypothetical protein